MNLLNPQLIVLGGYLGPLYRWVEPDVRAEMAARSLRLPDMTPRIAMPALADRSVLIGASEVAFRALLDDPAGCLAAARARPTSSRRARPSPEAAGQRLSQLLTVGNSRV